MADVVFGYRWLCAKAQRHRVTVEFLGIDLSRAFDTTRRDKLLDTLQTFLGESELRMIRFLLCRHLTPAPSINRRLPGICNNNRHTARRQPQPGTVHRLP